MCDRIASCTFVHPAHRKQLRSIGYNFPICPLSWYDHDRKGYQLPVYHLEQRYLYKQTQSTASGIIKRWILSMPCEVSRYLYSPECCSTASWKYCQGKKKQEGTYPRWSMCHSATVPSGHSNKGVLTERNAAKPHLSEVLHPVIKQTNTN